MRLTLLLLGFTLTNVLFGQENSDSYNTHELGLTLLSIRSNYGHHYNDELNPVLGKGIQYYLHKGSKTVRFGFDYYNELNTGTGDFQATSDYREFRFRIGVAKSLRPGTFQPYIGSDITVMYAELDHKFSGGVAFFNRQEHIEYRALGLSPTTGFKVQLPWNISLQTEINLEFLFLNKDGGFSATEPVNGLTLGNIYNNELVMRVNPVNYFSVNYSF